ncbi:hypothetical protein TASIC1_0007053800 [Trichoderma asperellum]|uniref:Uncharacterized protein n=1 Tax=Trichoderma asperellum TaxID=101201 RepID=A0A6V8QYY9_TRIAP|nr:hypothetical protein TASIC1_0007053800 [Trichoderma asperellum]
MSISTLAPPSSSYWVSAPAKMMAGRRRDAEFGSRQAVDPVGGTMGCVLQQQDSRIQQANNGQTAASDAGSLAAIGRLTQQLGAKAARPEQRECFEALAARQRSLFSAAMNAARGTDGVPDSSAAAARPVQQHLAGPQAWSLLGPSFSAVGTVWRATAPPRTARSRCPQPAGAGSRRLGEEGDSAEAGDTGSAGDDHWPEAGHVAEAEEWASWLALAGWLAVVPGE